MQRMPKSCQKETDGRHLKSPYPWDIWEDLVERQLRDGNKVKAFLKRDQLPLSPFPNLPKGCESTDRSCLHLSLSRSEGYVFSFTASRNIFPGKFILNYARPRYVVNNEGRRNRGREGKAYLARRESGDFCGRPRPNRFESPPMTRSGRDSSAPAPPRQVFGKPKSEEFFQKEFNPLRLVFIFEEDYSGIFFSTFDIEMEVEKI